MEKFLPPTQNGILGSAPRNDGESGPSKGSYRLRDQEWPDGIGGRNHQASRFEIPYFDGDDTSSWLCKCEHYFQYNGIEHLQHKLDILVLHFNTKDET
ncbi:hypothetical protein FXO37_09336 [Capsicum annuum]|nr:hypothetical protein FXO37_09336 [Capsicum annuum]